MGVEIEQAEFDEQTAHQYRRRLVDNLQALEQLLNRPGFGRGPITLGAELELYLVDSKGRVLPRNVEIQRSCADPRLTLELNRFNLEFNLTPVPAKGRPFSSLETEMVTALELANSHAATLDGQVVPIGILPTLRRRDLGPKAMTNQNRYQVLTSALQRMRGDMFSIKISGKDPISLRARDVTLEGANTSMQLHLRVEPSRFADIFNAIQMVTPVSVGISANSPFLFGHRLWHETRIPLFKHSIDGRNADSRAIHLPSRVNFGNGWVRRGAYELFAATVQLHDPILPVCNEEDALAVVAAGDVPQLHELRLHQGTCWPWNRPVYDPQGGGHLRIELRALPAGPSPCDMAANAAFVIGAALGLSGRIEELLPAMPFSVATHNFYRAAERGIGAKLLWPRKEDKLLCRTPILEVARSLLPVAADGLAELGVTADEAAHYLGLIECRLDRARTGAVWQLRVTEQLRRKYSASKALRLMLRQYMNQSTQNLPVADWVIKG